MIELHKRPDGAAPSDKPYVIIAALVVAVLLCLAAAGLAIYAATYVIDAFIRAL